MHLDADILQLRREMAPGTGSSAATATMAESRGRGAREAAAGIVEDLKVGE